MKNVKFKPWIGDNFGKSEYGRLLVLGDSNYFINGLPENLPYFNIEKIKELDDTSAKFHNVVNQVFNQKQKHEIWDKVAFANAIQTPFTSSQQKPTSEDFISAKLAFREYLDILKPNKVVVFSSRVWEHCFRDEVDVWGTHIDKIDNRWNIRELDYTGGNCLAIGIHHPSARGFSIEKFRNVLDNFLSHY